MAKYIDLLRAHQQGKSARDAEMLELQPDEQSSPNEVPNPYSQTAHTQDNYPVSSALLEELVPVGGTESKLDNNALIADDETSLPSYAAANDAQPQPITHNSPADTTASSIQHAELDITRWLKHITHHVLKVFQAAQQQQATDISPLNELLRSLIDHINATPKTLDALELKISQQTKVIRDIDASNGDLVQKSIMMMLYTIKTGQQLKLQHQELMHMIVAAMLHHIGMAMIPDAIRHKKERLSLSELEQIKQAPEAAHTYLKSCHIEDESILLAAVQAAERYDGSGGTRLSGHEIAWSARLVSLLSMFEALTHFRPYRQRLLPRDAIRELVNQHKKAFDPSMLKALIESISLYPVGTFVQINTGEIGQVVVVHNKFPLRPIILISMDKYGHKAAEREIDLKAQPNLMIQKCMYEESLADLKQGQPAA